MYGPDLRTASGYRVFPIELEKLYQKSYFSLMKTVSITEAKNRLSALIDGLRGGGRVLIVDRGRPVARLEPVVTSVGEQDGRLSRLLRDGIVRPPRASLPRALLKELPPGPKRGTSVLSALLEERREGR